MTPLTAVAARRSPCLVRNRRRMSCLRDLDVLHRGWEAPGCCKRPPPRLKNAFSAAIAACHKSDTTQAPGLADCVPQIRQAPGLIDTVVIYRVCEGGRERLAFWTEAREGISGVCGNPQEFFCRGAREACPDNRRPRPSRPVRTDHSTPCPASAELSVRVC